MTNDELVEAVARLVTPWAFDLTPAHYRLDRPEHFKETRAYAAQELAKDTARAVISTIYEALQEPFARDAKNTKALSAHNSIARKFLKEDGNAK